MTTKTPVARIALGAALVLLTLTLVPIALADKGGGGHTSTHGGGSHKGGGGTTSCTASAPRAAIDNTWAWGAPGSWGMPGQQLKYAIDVINDDVGCGSSSFVVSVSAPTGFSVSPASTITLDSASTGYVFAYVTSPAVVPDGDYPVQVTVTRAGTSQAAGPFTSYYKVYSSDTIAPSIYWMNPSDGGAVSGSSVYIGFASSDDHAVKQLDVYLDGALVATTLCDDISYDCQLSYQWSIRKVSGQHTATFRSTDWVGNVASQTVTFTVN